MAGIAVRHPLIVAAGNHYGVTIATCVPADPESKGGTEATVRIAKPTWCPPTPTCETNTETDSAWRGGVKPCVRTFLLSRREPGV